MRFVNYQYLLKGFSMSYFSISKEDFQSFTITTQTEILAVYQTKKTIENTDSSDGELTKKQVNDLLSGLSEKSKGILKTIVKEFEYNQINYTILLKKLNMVDENLTGVWSGITKRARGVSHDKQLKLIEWVWPDDSTCIGSMHPNTFNYISDYFK